VGGNVTCYGHDGDLEVEFKSEIEVAVIQEQSRSGGKNRREQRVKGVRPYRGVIVQLGAARSG
jgi:hypothetical protein